MIAFQFCPFRLYPKICEAIRETFPDSVQIHEIFKLAKDSDYKNPDNVLNLTPNHNFKFERHPVIYGIFNKYKIPKKEGDTIITIRHKKKFLQTEYFAGLRFFGSQKYFNSLLKPDGPTEHRRREYLFFKEFNKFSDEELFNYLSGPQELQKITLELNNIKYEMRTDFFYEDEDTDIYDYVGDFENWHQTIKDIKELTGLDLSHLKNEETKSYKN